MPDFRDVPARISQALDEAERARDSGSYAKVASALSDFEAQLREYIQETTKTKIQTLIEKLQTDSTPTADELALLRLCLVGDADDYVKLENSFGEWVVELKRVIGELSRVRETSPDLQTASRLRALLRDGTRVAWDIHHYLEHKERIDAFDEATHELDRDERKTLVGILQHKLSSQEF